MLTRGPLHAGPEGRPPDPLTPREAIAVCNGIVSGVRDTVLRAHNNVHAGHHENVLLDGGMTAKISDLGTASAMAEGGGATASEPDVHGHYSAP